MRNAGQPAVLELSFRRDWAVGAAKRMKISSMRLLSAFLLDSCFKRDAMLQAFSAKLNILAKYRLFPSEHFLPMTERSCFHLNTSETI
jgi:hypothetical protein